jgi:hypothetical protein
MDKEVRVIELNNGTTLIAEIVEYTREGNILVGYPLHMDLNFDDDGKPTLFIDKFLKFNSENQESLLVAKDILTTYTPHYDASKYYWQVRDRFEKHFDAMIRNMFTQFIDSGTTYDEEELISSTVH